MKLSYLIFCLALPIIGCNFAGSKSEPLVFFSAPESVVEWTNSGETLVHQYFGGSVSSRSFRGFRFPGHFETVIRWPSDVSVSYLNILPMSLDSKIVAVFRDAKRPGNVYLLSKNRKLIRIDGLQNSTLLLGAFEDKGQYWLIYPARIDGFNSNGEKTNSRLTKMPNGGMKIATTQDSVRQFAICSYNHFYVFDYDGRIVKRAPYDGSTKVSLGYSNKQHGFYALLSNGVVVSVDGKITVPREAVNGGYIGVDQNLTFGAGVDDCLGERVTFKY